MVVEILRISGILWSFFHSGISQYHIIGGEAMSGFFEAIARERFERRLLAAWVIDGEAIGSKALFLREGEVYREDSFPEMLCPPSGAGIVEVGGVRVFIEPLNGKRKLVVCGAGHVALWVIRLGVMLGFDVTVIEDRETFADRAREAGAGRVLCKPFGEALSELDGDDELTAFVVMTREHAHDMDCLRHILQKSYAYAGMMGSHTRTAQLRQQLLEEGFDAHKVEGLRMPIGLPIGARTPEEIAVSVAAELISVMNAVDTGEGFPSGMLDALIDSTAPGVLAVIVEKRGEAPRRPGTKMLVMKDGRVIGTVGGGLAEAEILKTAREMLHAGDRRSRLMQIEMKAGTMQCGGELSVLLVPV